MAVKYFHFQNSDFFPPKKKRNWEVDVIGPKASKMKSTRGVPTIFCKIKRLLLSQLILFFYVLSRRIQGSTKKLINKLVIERRVCSAHQSKIEMEKYGNVFSTSVFLRLHHAPQQQISAILQLHNDIIINIYCWKKRFLRSEIAVSIY